MTLIHIDAGLVLSSSAMGIWLAAENKVKEELWENLVSSRQRSEQ